MPLTFLLDEHLRGRLLKAIRSHNAAGRPYIDTVQVGDPPDLPRRTLDPAVLLWAERENRILVSRDRGTMPGHLADHLRAGHHSPGVILLLDTLSYGGIVAELALAAHAGFAADFADQIKYIP